MAKPCEPPVLLPRRLRGSEISDVRLFTDSFENKIYAYDYTDGQVSGRRVFVDAMSQGLPPGTYPDGLCIDKDGGVWSARCVLTEHSCADMQPLIIAPGAAGAGPGSSGTPETGRWISRSSSQRRSISRRAHSEVSRLLRLQYALR